MANDLTEQEKLVEQYIQELVTELNIANHPEEEQNKILDLVQGRFEEVILNTTLSLLSEDQKAEFSKALDLEEPHKSEAIVTITSQIENLDDTLNKVLIHELAAFKYVLKAQ